MFTGISKYSVFKEKEIHALLLEFAHDFLFHFLIFIRAKLDDPDPWVRDSWRLHEGNF